MQALIRECYGPPEVLSLREVQMPEPTSGQVRIRIHAASLNDWDLGLLLGADPVNRLLFGPLRPRVRILGADIAGVVESVGSEVRRFKPGDRVHGDLSGAGFGGFASHVCVGPGHLAPLPDAMSFEEGAALPQAGLLAWQALQLAGELGPGKTVLLNGAGGGVGTLALQLLKSLGVEVTVVDRGSKLARLREWGADHGLDHTQVDFAREAARYDAILDVKTLRSPLALARALKPGGIYVTVGGDLTRLLAVLAAAPLGKTLLGKRMRLLALRPNQGMEALHRAYGEGWFRPVLDQILPLAQGPEAFRRLAAGDHFGKIILRMP